MNYYCWAIMAHLLFDYSLQPHFMAVEKAKNNLVLLSHCALWALGVAGILQLVGVQCGNLLWFLFFGHLLMDWMKCHKLPIWCGRLISLVDDDQETIDWARSPLGMPLWIDQAWHIFQVCLVVWLRA